MADERDTHIGKNLASQRGVRSQQALARAMRNRGWKWSQATVWAIEKGDRPLKLAEAIDLADELNVRLDDLIQEPELAVTTREITHHARQVVFHADRTINALVEFEHERRALEAAMDDAAKVPGWERPRSDELALALDYSLYKLVEIAQIHLDSEQHRLFNLADLTPEEIATLDVGHDTDDQEGEPDGIDQEAP